MGSESFLEVFRDEIRDTSEGERVRVRKLSQAEVKKSGMEEEKAARGYAPSDNIYYLDFRRFGPGRPSAIRGCLRWGIVGG